MIRSEYFMREPKVFSSPRLIQNPDVSIILPTYCRGDSGLLKRAIDSVLSQTFSSFELIVMDDGSTDATADVISSYLKSDDRIIHVRHDANCGLPALRVNEGLMMARADLCAYQFDDDRWTTTFLATVAGELQTQPDFEVAYSRSELTVPGGQQILGRPFDYQQLVATNFIANNSVVHRRRMFERFGGYDMHLVMRRLCDWDLWMRWGRHTPFLFVDAVLTMVEARRPESIGRTCAADRFTTRCQMSLDRDGQLRPDTLGAYVIDELDHLRHLGERKLDSVWRQQIAPYKSKFRQIWPAIREPRAKPIHVLVSKGGYASTYDVTVGNFAEPLAGDFAFTFLPLAQTAEPAIRCADILLLHRVANPHAVRLAEIARRHGKAVVFLADDDLLSLHEVSDEFSWLAPGEPARAALESTIQAADLVVSYSRLAQESIEPLNSRSVVMDVSIQRKWLARAKACLEGPENTTEASQPIRIGFAAGSAHREDLAAIWPAILEVSRQLGPAVEFHFWGVAPEDTAGLHSPFHCVPFTLSYEQYLDRLTSAGFDVMIAPLFAKHRATRAKCPIKFLEITAAGAIGVYSDVEPYRAVLDGFSGMKCENTVEAWATAILKAATLAPSARTRLLAEAIQTIERDFPSETQAPRLAATLRAALAHSQLNRSIEGRPRIAYFCHSPYLSGAGNRLMDYARLAQAFRFDPIVVLPAGIGTPSEEMQQRATAAGFPIAYLPLTAETTIDPTRTLDASAVEEIRHWLRQNEVSLAHSFNVMREVGEAARSLGIPHVSSLYEVYSGEPMGIRHCNAIHSDSFVFGDRWATLLDTPTCRIMPSVPDQYFEIPSSEPSSEVLTVGIFGSLQPRKGQLHAIEAVGLQRQQSDKAVHLRLFGHSHFHPDYLAACKEMAERYGVSDRIGYSEFVGDSAEALGGVDVVVCASDSESAPRSILNAMAAGRLVIAPNVGAIAEIVSPGTGILMPDNTATSICSALVKASKMSPGEWHDKAGLGRELVRQECSKFPVAAELFRLYHMASLDAATN